MINRGWEHQKQWRSRPSSPPPLRPPTHGSSQSAATRCTRGICGTWPRTPSVPRRAAARTWCPGSTAHRTTRGTPGHGHATALVTLMAHIPGPAPPSPAQGQRPASEDSCSGPKFNASGSCPLQAGAATPSLGGPPRWAQRVHTKRWQALKVRLDTMRRQGEQSAVAQLSGRKRVWPTEVRELGTCQLSRKGAGSSASPTTELSSRVRSLAASPSQIPGKGQIIPIAKIITTAPRSPGVALHIPYGNYLRLISLLSPFYR